ncbi:hypothetical protein EI42_06135 [Thermosporothrix hazakensis]|jgi:hypothetical protein|uniref:Uncharacterized protein n=1 Tax=Thermosporothrix hazakensis TaxID=644383 RepID=A0A326TSC4_THEHA|nr:hypothetical protein [Thermosporothrix hazakensis]PZW19322.1 hypothetical protein EI42_06135 [Thermosporothrix hazakensis]GCE48239.1 hypothetical protein KTH_31080 [Thermosporothrix hazakensis]
MLEDTFAETLADVLEQLGVQGEVLRVWHFESDLFPAHSNHCFRLSLGYGGREEVFTVFTGQGWWDITIEDAVRRVLDHVGDVFGAPDVDYWLEQHEGRDLLHSVVEDMTAQEARQFQEQYFEYCHDMELRLCSLFGEEVVDRMLGLSW